MSRVRYGGSVLRALCVQAMSISSWISGYKALNRERKSAVSHATSNLIPECIDQYPCAQYLNPIDMMRHG